MTPVDVAQLCAGNPLTADGKRENGPLDLRNVDLRQFVFNGIDLSDSDFRDAQLQKARFERISFQGSDLSGANVEGATFDHCDFSGAKLRGLEGAADFDKPELKGAAIGGLDLRNSDVYQSSLLESIDWHLAQHRQIQAKSLGLSEDHDSRLPDRRFDGYKFGGRELAGFDFRGASLVGASFSSAVLAGADLRGARLEDAELGGADLTGTNAAADQVRAARDWLWARYDGDLRTALRLPPDHNERIKQHDFNGYDLSGLDLRKNGLTAVNLQGARLVKSNLSGLQLPYVNLENAKLAGAHLDGANLANANLSGVDLSGVDFQSMNLVEANFRRARLVGADFSECSLKGVKFDNANLTEAKFLRAKLTEATGLEAWQFRGADVTEAELPEAIADFKGVALVGKIAPAVSKQFLTLLAACLYCWLTIATTTDVSLILGSATQKLPIVQTEIPIVGFYWFAPVVLVIVFLYFQLNLHQMWEALAKLPAIFVDSRRIDEHVYPWLLIQKVRAHYERLRKDYTLVPRLENQLGSLLAYGAVPITLLAFCYRARVRHDGALTAFQVALWTLALLVALQFHRYAVETLGGVAPVAGWRSLLTRRSARCWSVALASGLVLWSIVPALLSTSPIDLAGAELSTKPEGWVEGQLDTAHVKGAKLAGLYLENAKMAGAFLVNADLVSARLGGADLHHADLRGAFLVDADMQGANLLDANLQGAMLVARDNVWAANNWPLARYLFPDRLGLPADHEDRLDRRDFRGYQFPKDRSFRHFRFAKLSGANFEKVDLAEADFLESDLSQAILRNCNLTNASFVSTQLTKTDLRGADLTGARGLNEAQLREAVIDETTKLPEVFAGLVKPPAKSKKR